MKNKLFVLLLSVVVLALLLAGCGSGEVSEETAVNKKSRSTRETAAYKFANQSSNKKPT
jgi:outer membrane murein-binding lipoprotein Lpp